MDEKKKKIEDEEARHLEIRDQKYKKKMTLEEIQRSREARDHMFQARRLRQAKNMVDSIIEINEISSIKPLSSSRIKKDAFNTRGETMQERQEISE